MSLSSTSSRAIPEPARGRRRAGLRGLLTPATGRAGHLAFLDYLRIIAAWLVVWDHVLASWPEEHGVHLRLIQLTRSYFTQPLGIIQDFGWFAVAVFFLISGFVITHVASRDGVTGFVVKRIFRIYPLLCAAVLAAIALRPELREQLALRDVLLNMSLLNYFTLPQIITVGVAWTLIIEILYYAMTALTLRLRAPEVIFAVQLSIILFVLATSRSFGDSYFLFAATMSYLPFLMVGQLFYVGLYQKSVRFWFVFGGFVLCIATALAGIMSINTQFLPANNSYLINFFYACVAFYVCLRNRDRFVSMPLVRFLADISFAVYLVHAVLGRPAFEAALAQWGMRAGLVAAVAVTLVGSIIAHLLVERPLNRFGHRLAARLQPAVQPVRTA